LAIGIGDKQFEQEFPRRLAKYGRWEDLLTGTTKG
jgi:hypothetical protein